MKHVRVVTVRTAFGDSTDGEDVQAILESIFAFVTSLVEAKGKGNEAA